MVRLREIPRTAAFAWSTGSAPPLLVTGTKAGAVDADFSNETTLEIWELDLNNPDQAVELQPAGSVNVDSRFHDIAWSQPSEDHPRGIIAGALENGSLDLWDAEKLRAGASDAHITRVSKHSGAIKALQFNPFRPELLATAGAKGELYITDVINNAANPFRLGNSAARADDFECIDWNKKVPHILATGSSGGFVTVWDVKAKKENLTLNNQGRKAVSAVAWDPDVPTKLITATPNDQEPVILMWDLRNTNAPVKTLSGHDQGILSLSWCPQDGELLLSCGKDNRTICWNPHTGQAYGEFPLVTNWTFQIRWNPHNPSLLATASFDGKIAVQTIQNTNPQSDQAAASNQALDGEDFFARAQTQPQDAGFSLPKPPKWLERPVGVNFGFGGKVVKFGPSDGSTQKSRISISTFAADTGISTAVEQFEQSLQKGDLASICESKIEHAKTDEEKADWKVIETLISSNPRKQLIEYLGFDDTADQTVNGDAKEPAQTNGTAQPKDDFSFFNDGGSGDNFLSELAATKGAKTNNPFKIYSGSESDADKSITRALMMGSFEKALAVCLKEDRMSDAFMIAICGGQKCIDKAQAAYFRGKGEGPNYLRLLASVVGKNLWDVVHNADLADWKEVMATLCTFADQAEFPDLCEALGDRLQEQDSGDSRKDASFCYLAGSKLEKVVGNWAQELRENENADIEHSEGDSSFSIHAKTLQDFIEKVTVFRDVTKFKDSDLNATADWKLAPLYAKYTEYADILASHGQLQIAERFLDLLPTQYPAAEVARNRVKQATRKAAPQATQRAAAPTTAPRGQRVVPTYAPTHTPAASQYGLQQPPSASPYAPSAPTLPTPQAAQSPYAPTGAHQGYMPPGYQPPSAAPPNMYHQQQAIPPPPRNFNQSPSAPPPPKSTGPMSAWNDLPAEFGSKPPTRRGTPGVGSNAISSPFPNAQSSVISPPPSMGPPSSFAPLPKATPPTGPPPKGPPRMGSPAAAAAPGMQPERPSSSAGRAYMPAQVPQSTPAYPTPSIPRGPSPYNVPPAAAPPSSRYAPAPGSIPSPAPGMNPAAPPQRQVAPPPTQFAPPGQNPYGQPPQPQMTQPPRASPYATASGAGAPPPAGPPRSSSQAPPPGGPPGGPSQGGPMQSRPGTGQSNRSTPALAASKYPSGDRSHIPASAAPIYEILSADMARVKARAPAQFEKQVLDTEKRLNFLFDHLNNEDLLKPDTVQEMVGVAQAVQGRAYDQAMATVTEMMKKKMDQGGNWIVGVKRLIQMSKATPH